MPKMNKNSDPSMLMAVLTTDVSRRYRRLIDRELESLGVTRSQWWTLTNLFYRDGITQMELAEILDIGKSSTGKLLGKLEAKGWIIRRPDEQDGRANNIYLSDEIKPIVEKMAEFCIAVTQTTLVGFSDTEKRQLIKTLTKLSHGFAKPTDQAREKIELLRKELAYAAESRGLRNHLTKELVRNKKV